MRFRFLTIAIAAVLTAGLLASFSLAAPSRLLFGANLGHSGRHRTRACGGRVLFHGPGGAANSA